MEGDALGVGVGGEQWAGLILRPPTFSLATLPCDQGE